MRHAEKTEIFPQTANISAPRIACNKFWICHCFLSKINVFKKDFIKIDPLLTEI